MKDLAAVGMVVYVKEDAKTKAPAHLSGRRNGKAEVVARSRLTASLRLRLMGRVARANLWVTGCCSIRWTDAGALLWGRCRMGLLRHPGWMILRQNEASARAFDTDKLLILKL